MTNSGASVQVISPDYVSQFLPSPWLGDVRVAGTVFGDLAEGARFHKSLIGNGAGVASLKSICVFRLDPSLKNAVSAASSSSNATVLAAEHYERINSQLTELVEADDNEAPVEKGAVASALTLINKLKDHRLAPPAISWHGGDAIVMLWALGSATYAITVTEGELGYVVRENRKAIRKGDSISINAFRLEDLR